VNHPPVAANDILRADGTALSVINVLAKASDPDNDQLTVTIEQQPPIGTAAVNTDATVGLTGLPASFKGVTRFEYRVTDPSGAYAVATAVVFVGTAPFRATFVGDASGNGTPEVYLADFAGTPQILTSATQGSVRLQGYTTSANGATIAYRSEDPAVPASNNLTFVQTATPTRQNAISLGSGIAPVLGTDGKDQFQVSPDGQWIAVIAGQGSTVSLYIVSVTSGQVTQVAPTGSVYATQPKFSPDSKNLYFLSSPVAGGANKSLYFVTLASPASTVLISAASAGGTSDDVMNYNVSSDQARILIQANRGGAVGLYYINPQQIGTELQVSQPLTAGIETIFKTTLDLTPGLGGSATGGRVGYTVKASLPLPVLADVYTTYVADVSATPNPRAVGSSGAQVIGFRPDDAALLYSKDSQVLEASIDSATVDAPVGSGVFGWYDSTGNIVLLEQLLPSSYPVLATTIRGSFGTTQPVGTTSMSAQYVNVTGFGAGAAIIGEGPATGAAPTTARLALVNALAPNTLLYLADFESPLQLTSDIAEVVTY
jgi:hypothetical protein